MDKLIDDRDRLTRLILIIVLVSLIFFKIYEIKTKKFDIIDAKSDLDLEEEIFSSQIDSEEENLDPEEFKIEEIMVHISGRVKNPGLIILSENDRLKDAINLAGGLEEEADIDNINLAMKLKDEDKIYIPALGEDPQLIEAQGTVLRDVENSGSGSPGLIDLNKSTREELMSLSGIGEKTAEKIIDYREANPFRAIEDLMKVAGIGSKKFEAIKEEITVN